MLTAYWSFTRVGENSSTTAFVSESDIFSLGSRALAYRDSKVKNLVSPPLKPFHQKNRRATTARRGSGHSFRVYSQRYPSVYGTHLYARLQAGISALPPLTHQICNFLLLFSSPLGSPCVSIRFNLWRALPRVSCPQSPASQVGKTTFLSITVVSFAGVNLSQFSDTACWSPFLVYSLPLHAHSCNTISLLHVAFQLYIASRVTNSFEKRWNFIGNRGYWADTRVP